MFVSFTALPGLENLLNRVAENLEDKTNRSSNNTKKDVSIDMATAEGINGNG